ncbi:ShlB/FhaC/HecB family hemolysin secretion/activation protein [Roseateles amylovorans]|uniref:POTRA domain-containing protein n=1 Tax=Roseateles amylovorans TaxID=2978473 RepID=A0ABY6B618_9BURK|nr:ShlB/FhaC/HecB family hemolysin secretion/activation protein [Roseateles amylovorans]UXH79965.1 hypothetical protein N4261_08830 [Roseateles amylovorans]
MLALGMGALLISGSALAQAVRPPDAGLLKREETPPMSTRLPADPVRMAPRSDDAKGGEPAAAERRVTLRSVRIEGLTVLDEQELLALLGPVDGQQFTLTTMRGLAAEVQQRVQLAGRPFARAYLPPQDLSGGELRIAVVEGRYGAVNVQAHELSPDSAASAQSWLEPLKPGQPIGEELTRQIQLLSELPGIDVAATMAPGRGTGEGDLSVDITPRRRFGGDIRLDNHGSRYAGSQRLTATVYGNGLATLGDRGVLSLGANDGKGWQGAAAYSLPLGTSGVRAGLSGSRSHYELGKEFVSLGAEGRVDAVALQLTAPLVVTAGQRVDFQTGVQRQQITNLQRAVGASDQRQVRSLSGALQASSLLSTGGAVWGRLSAEVGQVRLQAAQRELDSRSARTNGGYLLVAGDAALLKPFGRWSVFLRGAGQTSDRNLDPSKKFVLGGADGVRAWPAAEAAGDDGVLGQAELRYRLGAAEPFAFVDAGGVRINHNRWDVSKNTRTIAGTGVGLRWTEGRWTMQGTVGWRTGALRDRPVSDPSAGNPQLWVSVNYTPGSF